MVAQDQIPSGQDKQPNLIENQKSHIKLIHNEKNKNNRTNKIKYKYTHTKKVQAASKSDRLIRRGFP